MNRTVEAPLNGDGLHTVDLRDVASKAGVPYEELSLKRIQVFAVTGLGDFAVMDADAGRTQMGNQAI